MKNPQLKLEGIVLILLGLFFLLWAYKLIFHIFLICMGAIILNRGLTISGYPSLFSRITQLFFY
ncbi:MAG: hypothetical protein WC707_06000 [Candidatus Babeliaceae bacterium]